MKVALLHDESLVLHVEPSLAALVASWVPAHRLPSGGSVACGSSMIEVAIGASAEADAPEPARPLLALGSARLHAEDAQHLRLSGDVARGAIELSAGVARLVVPLGADAAAAMELQAMLTIAAALLIGRRGGALIHAAAIVDGNGDAWLLPGDAFAGKSTTCASLVADGWSYLSDDQVVLRRDPRGGVYVEGWPREAHLDEGWTTGEITGCRVPFDAAARWPERWRRTAPLRGILLPSIVADQPTTARAASEGEALGALVRQSPWLLADAESSRAVLALLGSAVAMGATSLALGRDGYARGDVIARQLENARRQ